MRPKSVFVKLAKYEDVFEQIPSQRKKDTRTATCDKAGQPNDVCPYGQVMLPSAMMFTA